jgi:hypothetical protein
MNPALVPVVAALFVFGGLFTHTICERRHRSNWSRVHDGRPRGRAPKQIRRTALWSIYMGQMALPGGLLGLCGILAFGIGLVSIPGMILAIRIWRLGYAMLRRHPKAEQEARKLVRFAVILNIVGVLAAVLLFVAEPTSEMAVVSLILVAYAAVSFLHAKAMHRGAELLAAERSFEMMSSRPTLADQSPRH